MESHRTTERTTVGVLGGGSWGTALAIHCARMGHDTVLWARGSATVDAINTRHENPAYLPGRPCPPALRASSDLADVVQRSELILMVVPTQYIKETLAGVAHLLRPHQLLVSCSKGISLETLETVDEVLARLVPAACRERLAFLSGPSFAAEVAAGQPTAVTVAAKDEALAARVQSLLSSPCFRCYRSTDVVGVELGGALKNVLAIACGISDGMGFGHNGRAALITRGLYEITKLAVAKGASPLTMAGLAGMGDLVLTCTGDLSRNRTVGLRLGRGERLSDIEVSMGGAVAEGVPTARAIHNLARKLGVECPVMEGIYRVIHEGANAQEVVTEAMSRELKPEIAPEILRGALAAGATPASATAAAAATASASACSSAANLVALGLVANVAERDKAAAAAAAAAAADAAAAAPTASKARAAAATAVAPTAANGAGTSAAAAGGECAGPESSAARHGTAEIAGWRAREVDAAQLLAAADAARLLAAVALGSAAALGAAAALAAVALMSLRSARR